ncbi:MAG: hypothetical protein ABL891_03560 [Burkholderiales bacterium]
MLFSALSPAMASVLFSDRPDMLARMLALPTQPDAQHLGNICHQGVSIPAVTALPHYGAPELPPHDSSDHAAHGIVCSFCLVMGSVVTLPAGALIVAVTMMAGSDGISPSSRVQPALANSASTRHPRDPPKALR